MNYLSPLHHCNMFHNLFFAPAGHCASGRWRLWGPGVTYKRVSVGCWRQKVRRPLKKSFLPVSLDSRIRKTVHAQDRHNCRLSSSDGCIDLIESFVCYWNYAICMATHVYLMLTVMVVKSIQRHCSCREVRKFLENWYILNSHAQYVECTYGYECAADYSKTTTITEAWRRRPYPIWRCVNCCSLLLAPQRNLPASAPPLNTK